MSLPSALTRFFPRRATIGARARLFPGVPVTALETRGLRDEGVLVIDVREPREWAAGHVDGSRNIPLDVIGPDLLPHGIPVVLVCRSGHRAGLAARILTTLGMDPAEIFVLGDGLASWTTAEMALVNVHERAGHLV